MASNIMSPGDLIRHWPVLSKDESSSFFKTLIFWLNAKNIKVLKNETCLMKLIMTKTHTKFQCDISISSYATVKNIGDIDVTFSKDFFLHFYVDPKTGDNFGIIWQKYLR